MKGSIHLSLETILIIIFAAIFLALLVLWVSGFFSILGNLLHW